MPTYHSSNRSVRRFSRAVQSWFPVIHQQTFSGVPVTYAIQSAVHRTLDRA